MKRTEATARRDLVLDLILRGYGLDEIAQSLSIPLNTVRRDRNQILARLLADEHEQVEGDAR